MNYAYAIPGANTDPTSFVANTSMRLGSISQSAEALSTISVDYSALVPAVMVQSYSMRVSPGGSPQLHLAQPFLTPASPAGKTLTFIMHGGIPGRAYTVKIDASTSVGIRTDVLNVNILEGDDGECAAVAPISVAPPPNVSGDGGVYLNSYPRYYVSGTPPDNANVLDRWFDTTTGNVYDFVSDGVKTFWMLSISGSGSIAPTDVATIIKMTPIHPDGTTTTFALTATTGQPVIITNTSDLFVSVDGVWQEPFADYIAGSAQITFMGAPLATAKIFMIWFATPTVDIGGADGANIVKMQPLTPDGFATQFALTPIGGTPINVVGSNYLFVSVDGVWQEAGAQYTASGGLISFVNPPAATSKIFILWFAPPPS